jgi:hypothetical protein
MLCEHFAMGETLIVTEKYDFETAGTLYPSNVPRASQILEAIPIDILSSFYGSSSPIPRPSPVQARDLNLLGTAEQLLIRACMQGHSFSYWPIPASQFAPVPAYPLVVTSIHWARDNGLSGFPVFSPDANQRYYNHLPAGRQSAYSNALVGEAGGPAVQVALPSGAGTRQSRSCGLKQL